MWYAKCYIRAKGKGKCYGNNHFNQDGNGGLAVFQGAVTAPVPNFYNDSWIEREASKEQRKKCGRVKKVMFFFCFWFSLLFGVQMGFHLDFF